MSTFTEAITESVKALESAEKTHQIASDRLATIRGHAGQSGYSVTVNGVTVAVSTCDMGDSYAVRSTGNLTFRRDRASVSPERVPLTER